MVTNYRDWRGLNGVRRVSPAPVKLQLTLTDIAPSYFRPSQPTDGHPLPAIVSPRLAGLAGAGRLVPFEAAGGGSSSASQESPSGSQAPKKGP